MNLNIPNLLTMSRILVIPIMIPLFFIDDHAANWTALGIYTYACVTDFFDGYLARKMNIVSALGRFLDPIADKLLIGALLVMLVAFDRLDGIHVLPAVVILCRELLVSGLREFLAQARIRVPVTTLAKWKTTIQMLCLGFLITGAAGPDFGPLSTLDIGIIGAWLAAALTIFTGYDYMKVGLVHIRKQDEDATVAPDQATGSANPQ